MPVGKLFRVIKQNRRSLFYTFGIAVSLMFMLALNAYDLNRMFLSLSVFPATLLFFEFYTSRKRYLQKGGQMDFINENTTTGFRHGLIFHHLLLPLILLAGSLGFIFFTSSLTVDIVLIIFISWLYFILFANFKYIYTNNLVLERKTHYIFDLIKIVSFFLFTFLVFNFSVYLGSRSIITAITLGFLSFIFITFEALRRDQLHGIVLGITLLISTLTALNTYFLVNYTEMNIVELSVVSFLVYYISGSLMHHKLSGTFTKEIFAEYIVMTALFTTLLFILE